MSNLTEIGPKGCGKEVRNIKSLLNDVGHTYKHTDRQTDAVQKVIRNAHMRCKKKSSEKRPN